MLFRILPLFTMSKLPSKTRMPSPSTLLLALWICRIQTLADAWLLPFSSSSASSLFSKTRITLPLPTTRTAKLLCHPSNHNVHHRKNSGQQISTALPQASHDKDRDDDDVGGDILDTMLTSVAEKETTSSRRLFLSSSLLATGSLLAVTDSAFALSPPSSLLAMSSSPPSSSLPWVKDPLNPKRTPLKIQDAENQGYNLEFVTYLTRFLLNFDPLAQQWWIDGASQIPKKASPSEILEIRQLQFSKFAASVELGLLQEFPGPQGPKKLLQSLLGRFCSMDSSTTTSGNLVATSTGEASSSSMDAKQQRILRETKEARRQLALLFGLLKDYQPTAEITKLLASVDNGSIQSVQLLSLQDTDNLLRGFAPGEIPTLEIVAPQAGEGFAQAVVKPLMTPTGGILNIIDMESTSSSSGENLTFSKPPTVRISPPSSPEGKAATATAQLKEGRLVGLQITDPGDGYSLKDQTIQVELSSSEGMMILVKGKAIFEMQISAVEVVNPGSGYAVEKPVRVLLTRGEKYKDDKAAVIGYGYPEGPRASFQAFRQSGDNRVRSFETELDGRDPSIGNDNIVSGTSSGGVLPPLPFTSKASSSQQLLSLLPQGFGLAYDKDKKRYYLMVDYDMVSSKYAGVSRSTPRMVPDFGPRGESPIERNMRLDLSSFARLSLAGAICSSAVHLALTPLDVVKTKVQTNPTKYPSIGSSFSTILKDEGAGVFFAGWVPTVTGYFVGGGVLYATTELLRRYLTVMAGGNGDSLEVVIILASAGISSALGATVFCPFETVRIRSVAQPDFATNSLEVVKRMVNEEGIGSLFNTIPVFLVKQVPYACVKFTIFDLSTEYLYRTYPAAQENLKLSLLISLVGGIMGGVAAAVVSNPADAVISELKKAKSDLSPQEAFQVLLDRAGVSALFKGLPLRMVFYSLTASLQFLVFDGIRFALGVGPDDLRLYMDVLGGVLTEKGTIA